MNAIIKDLKNLWAQPVQKADGSRRVTVDCLKSNQVGIPTAAAGPDRDSLFEQIHTSSAMCYAATDLANNFFSIPDKRLHRSHLLSAGKTSNTTPSLPRRYSNSAASPETVITLPSTSSHTVHYVEDIMLTGLSEEEVASNYSQLTGKTFACQRMGNKSNKNSGASHLSAVSRGPVVCW